MISSSQNPKIQQIRKLLTKKKERSASACFVVEGVRLVEEAFASKAPCLAVYFCEPVSTRTRQLLGQFEKAKVPCEEISSSLMDSISDTDTPQGILAIVKMLSFTPPIKADFVVIADGIHDPGNLGTLFRTAAAANADCILLAPGCADPYSPKVLRSSMGSHFKLPFTNFDWDSINHLIRQYQNMQVLAADSDGGVSCWESSLNQPTALIIGSEAEGPCQSALELADHRILIPMPGKVESLNAGVAAGILLFEVVRQRQHL